MQIVSIISTKGGVGKTTTAANLGGLAADAGVRVLLLDLDVQPTLSSYFELTHRAAGGIYELLAFNEQRTDQRKRMANTPTELQHLGRWCPRIFKRTRSPLSPGFSCANEALTR
ncbi:ParA family protein, partial [Pseudomonas amygdali]|uniref:ParA family protein n=1 Tax=Pseudomonas amygdali TaxID=47877 RepID=UPI001FB5F2F4